VSKRASCAARRAAGQSMRGCCKQRLLCFWHAGVSPVQQEDASLPFSQSAAASLQINRRGEGVL
jgi:hypothetical protein